MEKPMSRNVLKRVGFICVAFVASVGLPFIIATSADAQNPGAPPAGPGAGAPAAAGASANSGAGFIDLLTLPISAVQSIEILKDGASTTYGADAVAGVINLKLYKEYRGAQLTLYYGDTLDKDAGLYSGDLLFGTGDDKVSVVGDIFFFHHNSMFNHDRGNSQVPPFLSSNT